MRACDQRQQTAATTNSGAVASERVKTPQGGARPHRRGRRLLAALLSASLLGHALPAGAQALMPGMDEAHPGFQQIKIGYVQWGKKKITLSLSQNPPDDLGVAGALSGIKDNNTTGSFTKQQFSLTVDKVEDTDGALASLKVLHDAGVGFIVTDVPADTLLAMADSEAGKASTIFNVEAKEDRLRMDDCRANLVHIQPSHAMLADALAQYLVVKRWPRWFLLTGALPQDELFANDLKRAATRFGGQIVEERRFDETDTARRTDSGHVQIVKQMAVFTQNAPDYDIALAADESEIFGSYVPYRTWDPRPVAGSAGLVPTVWTPNHEQWAGYQMQGRFYELNHRLMFSRDANAWTAVRMVGDSALKAKSDDTQKIRTELFSEGFSIAAFKGQKLTIRKWNHQLRQPILLADGYTVVSVSPQEGFLHPTSLLDTMGYDEPESTCKF